MYLSHPFRITLCQVVVHSNNMNTFSFQRVQVSRKRRYQCLTFTGLHLGNTSLMQDNTTDQLNTEMLHIKDTLRSFPDRCICLWKNIIQCFSCSKSLFKFFCFSF